MSKLIGDRSFYKRTLALAIPVVIQNGITNFVSLLDNLMVGSIGEEQMSGVAISNQLFFVFNLCIFGAVSGAGIFTAQFHGNGDEKGVRETFRFKMMTVFLMAALSIGLFIWKGRELISLFLTPDTMGDVTKTLDFGEQYLFIMLIGILPFAVVQAYSGTLREIGETKLPMIAGCVAVIVNLVFNYILIFGHFGAPRLGVAGAAIATVISRFAELVIVMLATGIRHRKFTFIEGAFKSLYVKKSTVIGILKKGTPLMVNEALWSTGVTMMVQSYSTRGLTVVAAYNITSTVVNLFSIIFFALGNVVAIMIGHHLGCGNFEKAKDEAPKLIAFSTVIAIVMAVIMAICSPFIPMMYNVSGSVRSLATELLLCASLVMPFSALCHASYFTLRSGGRTGLTFFFDNGFMWLLSVPLAFVLSRFTGLPIVSLYLVCQMLEAVKSVVAIILVKKGIWIRNIIS